MGRNKSNNHCLFHYDGTTTYVTRPTSSSLLHISKLEEAFWSTIGYTRTDKLPHVRHLHSRLGYKVNHLCAIARQLTDYWLRRANILRCSLPIHLLHLLQYNIRRVQVVAQLLEATTTSA